MGKWINKKIKDLCIIGRGRVISQDEINSNPGIYPVYSSQSFNKGEMGKINSHDFDGEYITWTTDGAYAGTVFHRVGKFNCTNVCGTLKAKKDHELDLLFLSYLLSTKAKKYVSYTGNPKLMNGVMAGIELFLPENKLEQSQISGIIAKADTAIAQTESLIAKYQRIKTGLMQGLLTKGIDENGNMRNNATHKFVVKNGIEVPEAWDVDSLENFCTIHNNLRKPISALERFEKKGIYPYYGATGVIDLINEYRVEGKFMLIGEDGDHFLKFNRQNMTHLVNGKFNVSNHAHIISGRENCLTEWIHYFFCQRDITYFLTRQGAGRFKLNKATLQSLPICVPEISEQRKIVEVMVSFEKQFGIVKSSLDKLQRLKIGLMQDLLSGRVRVEIKENGLAV